MSGDTASESGSSSCSSRMVEPEVSRPEVQGTEKAEEMSPSNSSNTAGKVLHEEGAAEGAVGGAATVSNIERLLQQQRNEIMFELRRLQMGERPVTGQGHKEVVENFFTQQLQGPADQEEHRPETIHVEVRALAESRPVSSLLQSTRFRRSLESALRTSIGTRSPARTSPNLTPRSTPGRVPRRSLEQFSDPPLPSPLTREASQPISGIPSIPATTGAPPVSNNILAPPPPPVVALGNQQPDTPTNDHEGYPSEWLRHNVPSVSEQRDVGPWQHIEEMQREEFIYEISELVQRQLVTQSLEGNFRHTLEHMMEDRVARSGGRGEQTQAFIQSLQASNPHHRNDFSDLGIPGPDAPSAAQALSDDVSVISATAAVTVQQSQQQVQMSRELRALKSQMTELKTMLKMSIDMQLDTQRAIRQEVAAALAQSTQDAAAVVSEPSRRPVDDAKCLICIEDAADSVLYRCGHLCVCHTCGLQLKQRGCHCPVCRAPIHDIIRAYKSGQ